MKITFSFQSVLIAGIIATAAMTAFIFAGGKEGKVTGVISGAHCASHGMACHPDHDLTRAELPGVYTKEGKFYFIANVPQLFLAQWPTKEVSVEGVIYENERGIEAKKISIKDDGKWKDVFADGNIIDDMRHKEKLSDAVIVKGKWYCSGCAKMMEKKK